MSKNQVFAIRSDKAVTALVNGVSYYRDETDKTSAQSLYEKIKTVALNPTNDLVKQLVEDFDPTQKVFDAQSLVKDEIGNWYLKGFTEPLPSKLLTKDERVYRQRIAFDSSCKLLEAVNVKPCRSCKERSI